MGNPFYTYGQASGNSILPGMLGRSEAVAAELQSVQAGFADLATAGTDSGAAGAYAVTTPAGQPSSLADGTTVSFRAGNTNPGASTLAVNGGPTTLILRFDGSALQADDIAAGSWYTLTYNANFSAWCLPSSTAAITFPGVITGAAPVKLVGLSVGGTATSAMPIDATLAISTAISPTWVGNHKFSGTSTFSGPTTISGTAVVSGPLSVSGITTFSAGVSFTSPASFSGTATVSGVLAVSGTSTFSGPLTISGTSTFSGPTTFSGTSTAIAPWNFVSITVTGTSSLAALTVSALATFAGSLIVTGTSSFSGPLTVSGTSTFSGPFTLTGLLTAGTATFSGPLSVSGTATLGAANFSGAIVCASATGGAQGAGTVNATGYYVNGVNQTQTGSFTATLTGCTTAPTVSCTYTILNGKVVVLNIPSLVATSNTTSCSLTGLPASLQPAANNYECTALVENNGAVVAGGGIGINAGSGTMLLTIAGNSSGVFTNSGFKGIVTTTITYALS